MLSDFYHSVTSVWLIFQVGSFIYLPCSLVMMAAKGIHLFCCGEFFKGKACGDQMG